MKTDISTLSFKESKHYLNVFEQMGRLRLEADSNEHAEIGLRLQQRHAADTVRTGSSKEGFRVDTHILLEAMGDLAGWQAEENPGDADPVAFVDYFDHRTGHGSIRVRGAVSLARSFASPRDLSGLQEILFAVKGTANPNQIAFFLGQGGARHNLNNDANVVLSTTNRSRSVESSTWSASKRARAAESRCAR